MVLRGRQRKRSESLCLRAAIRTAMPPAVALVAILSFGAMFFKTAKAFLKMASLSGCLSMTASVACRGNGDELG